MSDRPALPSSRPPARRLAVSVDVVPLMPHGGRLATLLVRALEPRARDRWALAWDAMRGDETLDDAAARVARTALGMGPALLEQIAALGDRRRHPGDAAVSVGYLALVAAGQEAPVGGDTAWFSVEELPAMAPRHRALIDAALQALRARLDREPIAFRLLPPLFTLSQLQDVYELLLGRKLHKASFRRALHASWLVEPTDEWRTEGRGRPAQLFRYAPRKRRGGRRGVRFDALTGS